MNSFNNFTENFTLLRIFKKNVQVNRQKNNETLYFYKALYKVQLEKKSIFVIIFNGDL